MSEQILIFVNPIAGRGRGAQIAGRLADRLTRDGWGTEIVEAQLTKDEMARRGRGARAAIVIGGDGTVRTVADLIYGVEEMPPILPIPMGTANLMGRHLGIHWNDQSVESLVSRSVARREVQWLDSASANGQLFMIMAGVGIDAHIIHELQRVRSGPITFASYAYPAAHTLGFYDYPAVTVNVDGKTVVRDTQAVVIVGNVAEYGYGFPLLVDARPDDQLLDVCIVPCTSRAQILAMFLHAIVGEHLMGEGVLYLTGTHIEVTSSQKVPLQVDGEASGHTPVEIRLLPMKVPFIVPIA